MRRPPAAAATTAPPTATPTPSAVWEMASVAANAAGVAARDAAAKAPAGSAAEGLDTFLAASERLATALGATTARATQEVMADMLMTSERGKQSVYTSRGGNRDDRDGAQSRLSEQG